MVLSDPHLVYDEGVRRVAEAVAARRPCFCGRGGVTRRIDTDDPRVVIEPHVGELEDVKGDEDAIEVEWRGGSLVGGACRAKLEARRPSGEAVGPVILADVIGLDDEAVGCIDKPLKWGRARRARRASWRLR